MRLWHQSLIPFLPRQQLLGQWRECIALLGKGWGRKHKIVDYVFTYSESYLIAYTSIIIAEMLRREYNPNRDLVRVALMERRDKTKEEFYALINKAESITLESLNNGINIYPEHNDKYLQECIENLAKKGIQLDFSKK